MPALHSKAIQASETIKANLLARIDQLARDQIDMGGGDPSDLKVNAIRQAEREHFDRVAALTKHHGGVIGGPGNPNASHAQEWLAGQELDASAFEPPPSGSEPREIEWQGIKREMHDPDAARNQARFNNGGVETRGTFSGDLTSAKFALSLGYPPEAQIRPQDNEATPRNIAAADPIPPAPEPPEGLLADIANVLARTKAR